MLFPSRSNRPSNESDGPYNKNKTIFIVIMTLFVLAFVVSFIIFKKIGNVNKNNSTNQPTTQTTDNNTKKIEIPEQNDFNTQNKDSDDLLLENLKSKKINPPVTTPTSTHEQITLTPSPTNNENHYVFQQSLTNNSNVETPRITMKGLIDEDTNPEIFIDDQSDTNISFNNTTDLIPENQENSNTKIAPILFNHVVESEVKLDTSKETRDTNENDNDSKINKLIENNPNEIVTHKRKEEEHNTEEPDIEKKNEVNNYQIIKDDNQDTDSQLAFKNLKEPQNNKESTFNVDIKSNKENNNKNNDSSFIIDNKKNDKKSKRDEVNPVVLLRPEQYNNTKEDVEYAQTLNFKNDNSLNKNCNSNLNEDTDADGKITAKTKWENILKQYNEIFGPYMNNGNDQQKAENNDNNINKCGNLNTSKLDEQLYDNEMNKNEKEKVIEEQQKFNYYESNDTTNNSFNNNNKQYVRSNTIVPKKTNQTINGYKKPIVRTKTGTRNLSKKENIVQTNQNDFVYSYNKEFKKRDYGIINKNNIKKITEMNKENKQKNKLKK